MTYGAFPVKGSESRAAHPRDLLSKALEIARDSSRDGDASAIASSRVKNRARSELLRGSNVSENPTGNPRAGISVTVEPQLIAGKRNIARRARAHDVVASE